MSTPPSHPPQQPGPYGQQPGPYGPPPSGPYGQQPQQPPQPPQFGQPQPPYPGFPQQQGQQPYPAPWGAPPPPPKKRTGLIIGIVAGVVVLGLGGLGVLGYIGRSAGVGFPEAEYKLTLPKTVLDAKYELAEDMSASKGSQIEGEAEGAWDAKDIKAVVGQYTLGGDQTKGVLIVSGMYGRLKNTDEARDNMMKGAGESANATVAVQPEDFQPAGSDVTITCEVLTQSSAGAGGKLTMPMCAWADDNTGASVGEITTATATQDPQDVDLEAVAERAAKLREELRQPIG
ncbi:hypothetical protein ACFV9W_19590 [Streptomyces sp. NPDC059897]|uniref:hypothetical protein n=1 Tax=Streptomyces sp. NPDC059897 TaxID=3346994 RepID=UPI00365DE853